MDEAGHFTLPVLFLMGTIQCGSRELCPPRQEPRVQGDHRVGSFGGGGEAEWLCGLIQGPSTVGKVATFPIWDLGKKIKSLSSHHPQAHPASRLSLHRARLRDEQRWAWPPPAGTTGWGVRQPLPYTSVPPPGCAG